MGIGMGKKLPMPFSSTNTLIQARIEQSNSMLEPRILKEVGVLNTQICINQIGLLYI
jgi:hypothetical protein